MEFNNISHLIESDNEVKNYFNSLSASLQQQLLDRYTGVNNLSELKKYAEMLSRQNNSNISGNMM